MKSRSSTSLQLFDLNQNGEHLYAYDNIDQDVTDASAQPPSSSGPSSPPSARRHQRHRPQSAAETSPSEDVKPELPPPTAHFHPPPGMPVRRSPADGVEFRSCAVALCGFLFIVICVLSVAVCAVEHVFVSELGDELKRRFVGVGYWTGPAYFTAGILCLVSMKYRKKHMIIGLIVVSLLSCLLSVAQFVLGIIGCVALMAANDGSTNVIRVGDVNVDDTEIPLSMNAASVALSVVAFVTSLVCFSVCCHATLSRPHQRRQLASIDTKTHAAIATIAVPSNAAVIDFAASDQPVEHLESDYDNINEKTFETFTGEATPRRLYPNLAEDMRDFCDTGRLEHPPPVRQETLQKSLFNSKNTLPRPSPNMHRAGFECQVPDEDAEILPPRSALPASAKRDSAVGRRIETFTKTGSLSAGDYDRTNVIADKHSEVTPSAPPIESLYCELSIVGFDVVAGGRCSSVTYNL